MHEGKVGPWPLTETVKAPQEGVNVFIFASTPRCSPIRIFFLPSGNIFLLVDFSKHIYAFIACVVVLYVFSKIFVVFHLQIAVNMLLLKQLYYSGNEQQPGL